MSIKIFIIVLLLSLVKAASKYYDGPIRPYEFGFNIEGHQHRKESKDKNGIVMGEFGFITADNVYHVTVYATDENGNFKIVSMKNYKLGPTAPPTTTAATTTTTSTTPQPFRIITTARSISTPKPSGLAACGGCKIPDLSTTTTTTTTVQPATEVTPPETSTLYVPPFKIVNKNDIENVPANTPKPVTSTFTTNGDQPSKNNAEDTPQKLVNGSQKDSKAPSSKESTNEQKVPAGMQPSGGSKAPSSSSATSSTGANNSGESPPQSSSPPSKPNTTSSTTPAKFDHVNTANAMIQHILNGLLYRFNYTVGYHGHHEQGDRKGNKDGGYFSVGRDGIRREVTYKANEFGYQPHIKFEKVSPEETPREETEKKAGLKGFDFKWFWGGE
ncbi:protein lethal(3)malignant blood neoplasm 1 [Culex quinquefasciatus]|uniref:protein lethal(3)malignant blood neoplasm 1 n=1 Tax=Culex quinquefasciatus TaxID=7176 RepID=UPI0018E2C0EE|nr:protein lethal(3)malignant blood neoplasm 1 [Culex quinquefasciatus]